MLKFLENWCSIFSTTLGLAHLLCQRGTHCDSEPMAPSAFNNSCSQICQWIQWGNNYHYGTLLSDLFILTGRMMARLYILDYHCLRLQLLRDEDMWVNSFQIIIIIWQPEKKRILGLNTLFLSPLTMFT